MTNMTSRSASLGLLWMALTSVIQPAIAEDNGFSIGEFLDNIQKVANTAGVTADLVSSVISDIGDAESKIGILAHTTYADISNGQITNGSTLDISNLNVNGSTAGALFINTLVYANLLRIDDGKVIIADVDILNSFLGTAIITTTVNLTNAIINEESTVRIGTTVIK